jgi:hypothetical protein
MNCLDLKESNDKIMELIHRDEPFHIVRLGMGSETYATYHLFKDRILTKTSTLDNNAGIYCNNDPNLMIEYCYMYNEAIKNSDCLAVFPKSIIHEQMYFKDKYHLPVIYNRSLEPYFQLDAGITPWTHSLVNKKVLIVSPFVNSFIKQIDRGFKIFGDKHIFLDEQRFVFYKTYNTSAGNHLHRDFKETLEMMTYDIEKLDFDIALISCGGYGLPIGDFIKTKMKKSAIYIGGGLQLLFGVMGNRWKDKDIFYKHPSNVDWIRPHPDELPPHAYKVESNCYG